MNYFFLPRKLITLAFLISLCFFCIGQKTYATEINQEKHSLEEETENLEKEITLLIEKIEKSNSPASEKKIDELSLMVEKFKINSEKISQKKLDLLEVTSESEDRKIQRGFKMPSSEHYGDLPNAGIESNTSEGEKGLVNFLINPQEGVFHYLKILLALFSLIFMVISVASLITAGGDESRIQKNRNNLLYTILGFGVIMIGEKFPDVFSVSTGNTFLSSAEGTISNFENQVFSPAIIFIKNVVGSVGIFFMVISGWNMISSQGDDDKYQKNKNKLIISIIAFSVSILAKPFVLTFLNQGYEQGTPTVNQDKGMEIITHFINFILTLSGTIAVAFLVLGGFYYIANVHDEKTAEKGKHIVISTILALVIIFSSRVIVNFAIGAESQGGDNYVDVSF